MSNDLTAPPPEDDGYEGSLQAGRLIKGTLALWTDAGGWHDRDGMAIPSPMLAISLVECLQRWVDKKPITITEKPLPDPETLNAAIPKSEWALGLNGEPEPPWAHTVGVYLIDPATGHIYTYLNKTTGAHMAYDALREATIVMRTLRGARVAPLVKLISRPWKTGYGMRMRPYFDIVDWRVPGSGGEALSSPKPPPQLVGPATAPTTPPARATLSTNPGPAASPPIAPAAPASQPTTPAAPPPSQTAAVAAETLASMEPVAPVTMGELMKDEVPW